MTPVSEEVLVALGANLGDPLAALRRAVEALAGVVTDLRVGGVYRSTPEDGSAQPAYLNTAVAGRTLLAPSSLLAFGHGLEAAAGRVRAAPGGPRPLDVDLILHGATVCEGPQLTLPHPRWRQRAFVLLPALDVAAHLVDPASGKSVARIAGEAGVAPGTLPLVLEPGALAAAEAA